MMCRKEGSLERSQGKQEQRGDIRRTTGRVSDAALHLSDTQGRVGPPCVRAGSRGGSLLLGSHTPVRLTRLPSAPIGSRSVSFGGVQQERNFAVPLRGPFFVVPLGFLHLCLN